MTPTTESAFDALQMVHAVDELASGSSETEIQVLCYLASMLCSFDARDSLPDWGYRFAATGAGAPFSQELDSSISQLYSVGHLLLDGGTYSLSESGDAMRATLVRHARFGSRMEYLDSAANTALALTLPMATGAVMLEPQLASARAISHRRTLLDDVGVAMLEPYFAGLRREVVHRTASDTIDLFSAGVLWLKYLRAAHATEVRRAV